MLDAWLYCIYTDENTGSFTKHYLDLNDLDLPPGSGLAAVARAASTWLEDEGIHASQVQIRTAAGWDDEIVMAWPDLFRVLLLTPIPESWYQKLQPLPFDQAHPNRRWLMVSSIFREVSVHDNVMDELARKDKPVQVRVYYTALNTC